MNITPHLIPLHQWNKKTRGKQRGKTPMDNDWTSRTYNTKKKDVKKWVDNGHNIGFRIPDNVVVIDVDPRNGAKGKVRAKLAKDLGCKSWDDVLVSNHSVRTGGGGWHVYYHWPDDIELNSYAELVKKYPGVEFKKKGRQVLVPDSKHPDTAELYTQITAKKNWRTLPNKVVNALWREAISSEYGGGEITPGQLGEILDRINPKDYATNEQWMPLCMAAHHGTGGDGREEFVNWSLSDPAFADMGNDVRYRWDSLDANRDDGVKLGTLLYAYQKAGGDPAPYRAMVEYADYAGGDDSAFEETEELEHEDLPSEDLDDEEIIAECLRFDPAGGKEDLLILLRKIRIASPIAKTMAIDALAKAGKLKVSYITKLLAALDADILQDLGRVLAEHVIKARFNEGKHIMVMGDGTTWLYDRTHWRLTKDTYISSLCLRSFDNNRKKIIGDKGKINESALITQCVALLKMRVARNDMALVEGVKRYSIINCKNGEIHINKDGSYVFKEHSPDSHLTYVLDVYYNRKAKAPLWKQTLKEIFPKDKATRRYLAEVMGYMIQPNKNIAAWWMFRGQGGDGKSTIVKVLEGALGQAFYSAHSKLLSVGDVYGNSHAMAGLVDKLCVVIEELPANCVLQDAGLKLLSESGYQTANPKGRDEFRFNYVGGLIMCTNGWPGTRDVSDGMRRRANVIPFNEQFVKRGLADVNRVTDIINNRDEMSGVLNWLLSGLKRLRDRGGFDVPVAVKYATDTWFNQSNNVTLFVSDLVKPGKDKHKLTHVYGVYKVWCVMQGLKEKSSRALEQDLKALGFEVSGGKDNQKWIKNIELDSAGGKGAN